MHNLFAERSAKEPGYRLHKLEAYNWGTFDSPAAQIHVARPAGQTALLVGQNGSGKSTLVDALLTLLVRPVVRNYNVAAGAKKRERDERSYVKGAYGRFSRDDDSRAEVQFLRSGAGHYSALLACFRNECSGGTFTLAQVLYLDAEGRAEKVYCFAAEERSLGDVCNGLTSTDKLRQQLAKRGFRATTNHSEYHGWFVKATGVRGNAMDMFNQTVAVKDIVSLNRFIRDHMLEAKPWGDRVDDLLNHFTQLSEAHRSLVAIRKQFMLLEPIAAKGANYQALAQRLEKLRQMLDAAQAFFWQKTLDLFAPACAQWRGDLTRLEERRGQLAGAFAEANEECRRLTNEIEHAGGERLRQIPLLIEKHESERTRKAEAHRRYHQALATLGIAEAVHTAADFRSVDERLAPLLVELDRALADHEQRYLDLAVTRRQITDQLEEDRHELEALEKRQGNLPESMAELRRRLCADLRLVEKELPFAAELMAVKPLERDWEPSIEMVLRGLALSLLVPQRYYAQVSGYLDRTGLLDSRGRGQRLVYLRVGQRAAARHRPAPGGQGLLNKLAFREGHALLPWLKAELEERFDFRCCDAIEEFQAETELALTRQRHVKLRAGRHEKDDRSRVTDPRQFVLGWDNREKQRRLRESLHESQHKLQDLDQDTNRLQQRLVTLRDGRTATLELQQARDFAAIDFASEDREIASLLLEKRQIEESNDAVQALKQRLAEAESRAAAAQAERDAVIAQATDLQREIRLAEQQLAEARDQLARLQVDGSLQQHALRFADLESCLADDPLDCSNLLLRQRTFGEQQRQACERLRATIEPLKNEICNVMGRFLRDFPAEYKDLDVGIEYLESFLGLRQHIEREDLPRHEQRFKERLDEKVTHEIGLLAGELRAETSEIRAKIDLLNQSLRQVEYRAGTHMLLEPRPVRDRDVAEFQSALQECLSDTFEGTPEANEARYLRIEKLIVRLRDDVRWRERVTDVRRWFDFAAREVDSASGVERGYYEDSTGQSGGEKAKLAFTILVAAIAYQYDLDPQQPASNRFHFVVVDEMFSKVDDQYAEYALKLFERFGLQLLIVAPLDAKARITEHYVGCYLHVVKDAQTNRSEIIGMTARQFEDMVDTVGGGQPAMGETFRRAAR